MISSFSCAAIFEKYRLKASAVFWVFFISLVAVQYQGVPISHNNNKVSHRNFAAYGLHQIQWINIDPSRCTFSILINEIRVPSLSVSSGASKLVLLLLPVSYSQKYSRNKPHVKMFLIKDRVLQSEKIVTNGRRLCLVIHGQ